MKKPDLDIQKILFPILRFEGIDFKTWFPPNWFFFIDIKICFMVISNYGMNFRPNLKRGRTQTNFPDVPKWKMETLVFSLPVKKSKLFLIFFLLSWHLWKEDEHEVGLHQMKDVLIFKTSY